MSNIVRSIIKDALPTGVADYSGVAEDYVERTL